jgi:alpha-ketoglutarate-dependent taurine dioxygenase
MNNRTRVSGLDPRLSRRKAVSLDEQELIQTSALDGLDAPVVVTPRAERLQLAEWTAAHATWVLDRLGRHGALLFRGFTIGSVDDVERFMRAIAPQLLNYTYASTPRSQVKGAVYTSTEYPADQVIPMHNEMSYTRSWPMKIAFFCAEPAPSGGATPIADSHRVYERIEPRLRERFERVGVMYVRNYTPRLDLPWQAVFRTESKAAVESYCQAAGLGFTWPHEDHLRTWQVCPAVADHPDTGARVWFNQAHLFHVSSVPAALREALLREFAEEDLPRQAYYGDGASIEPDAIEAIRSAFAAERRLFTWQQGDVLLLDNIRFAHGREPFEGPRRVMVVMGEPGGVRDQAAREANR